MNLKSTKKILFVLLISLLIGTFEAIGQPGNPDDDPPVPIAGIGYLLALGGALGIKKIYDIRKGNNDN